MPFSIAKITRFFKEKTDRKSSPGTIDFSPCQCDSPDGRSLAAAPRSAEEGKFAMKECEAMVVDLQRLLRERLKLFAQARAMNEPIATHTERIRERIQEGETTGDRIRDFVLLRGGYDEREEERYRKIDEALRGHTGEFVLVKYWEHVCIRHVLIPRPGHENVYEDRDRYLAGTLQDEKLVFSLKTRSCSLPTAKRVLLLHPKGEPGKNTRPIAEELMFGPNHFLLDGAPLPQGVGEHMVSRVIVGDKNVKDWLSTESTPKIYEKCAELLGKLILTGE